MKVAINGAGIAGTALVYWLRHSGYEVVLVEKTPKFCSAGLGVNFWGVSYKVAEPARFYL